MSTTSLRRPKWQPTLPPPPTPKILHFPRRIRRKQPNKTTTKHPSRHHSNNPRNFHQNYYHHFSDNKKTKLESLFGQEREFSRTDDDDVTVVLLSSSSTLMNNDQQRRERVEDLDNDDILMDNDKWRFQAEILRAECSFLRMEKECAFKKLERNRKQLKRALTSAVQALISGRDKMCEGTNENVEYEKELEELAEKLHELQKSSRGKNVEFRNCHDFDKKACHLQHRLEKLGGRVAFEKRFQENAESSSPTSVSDGNDKESHVSELKNSSNSNDNVKVEMIRRKMEGFSMGILDRMEEEYGSMLTTTANSSAASSTSTSKRVDYPQPFDSLTRQLCQEQLISEENKQCSGRCKTLVRRIMDQVRAETEQWSQMQTMLGQIRTDMEELQASRDLWEDRALKSEHEIPILRSAVQEWKAKAVNSEAKAHALQTELSKLKEQLNRKLSVECGDDELNNLPSVPLDKHIKTGKNSIQLKVTTQTDDDKHQQEKLADVSMISVKNSVPLSLGKQIEQEKRLLWLRRKEHRHINTENHRKDDIYGHGRNKANICNDGSSDSKRTPFRDIGNSSPLTKYPTVGPSMI